MKISREDVVRVAELAYLDLSESELETYRAQVDEILEYIGKLNQLDTTNVEPMAQVLTDDQTADATLRDDTVVPCGIAAEILRQARDPEPPFSACPRSSNVRFVAAAGCPPRLLSRRRAQSSSLSRLSADALGGF